MTTWYYKNGEQQSGPHDDREIRNAVGSGKITPETMVRQGENGTWFRANQIPGLLTAPMPPSMSQPPTMEEPRQGFFGGMMANAKTGAAMAQKKVELENINRRLMPQVHRQIGDAALKQSIGKVEFPSIYSEIEQIQGRIQSRPPLPIKEGETLKEKTFRIAEDTKNKTLNQKDEFLRGQKITELGKQLSGRGDLCQGGVFPELFSKLASLSETASRIQAESGELKFKKHSFLSKKTLRNIGIGFAIFMGIGILAAIFESPEQAAEREERAARRTEEKRIAAEQREEKERVAEEANDENLPIPETNKPIKARTPKSFRVTEDMEKNNLPRILDHRLLDLGGFKMGKNSEASYQRRIYRITSQSYMNLLKDLSESMKIKGPESLTGEKITEEYMPCFNEDIVILVWAFNADRFAENYQKLFPDGRREVRGTSGYIPGNKEIEFGGIKITPNEKHAEFYRKISKEYIYELSKNDIPSELDSSYWSWATLLKLGARKGDSWKIDIQFRKLDGSGRHDNHYENNSNGERTIKDFVSFAGNTYLIVEDESGAESWYCKGIGIVLQRKQGNRAFVIYNNLVSK